MKKMFKSLVIGLAALGLVAGYSYAGSVTDTATGSGWANDPDGSYSQSYWGYGNDWASAGANGGGGFNVNATTTGSHFAFANVDGIAQGFADTDSYAFDTGFSSYSGASASVDGWSAASGTTLAGFTDWRGRGVDSSIYGDTYFQADVNQSNTAKEVGYSAGGVWAENGSYAGIGNGRSFSDNNDLYGFNYEGGYTEGTVRTSGSSSVNIDPYGNNRSISAQTQNSSYADTNHSGDSYTTYMNGGGAVGGTISNTYGATVGGMATFNYDGYTDGAHGSANMNANIYKTGSSTTVIMNASSSSSLLSD